MKTPKINLKKPSPLVLRSVWIIMVCNVNSKLNPLKKKEGSFPIDQDSTKLRDKKFIWINSYCQGQDICNGFFVVYNGLAISARWMTDFFPLDIPEKKKTWSTKFAGKIGSKNDTVNDRCFLVTEHFHILRHPNY